MNKKTNARKKNSLNNLEAIREQLRKSENALIPLLANYKLFYEVFDNLNTRVRKLEKKVGIDDK